MKMKEKDIYIIYVKNVKSGKPAIVEDFRSYEEAEKYWNDTIIPHRIHAWGVRFHFEANKESDDLNITKEVIFGKKIKL